MNGLLTILIYAYGDAEIILKFASPDLHISRSSKNHNKTNNFDECTVDGVR